MSAFDFDLTQVSAGFDLLAKGEYEVKVGKGKAFERTTKKGEISIGIRFPIEVAEGSADEGKKQIYTVYLHNETSQGFAKQWVMACLGYHVNKEDEKRFNDDYRGKDWSFDAETGAVGEMWQTVTGTRVFVAADTQIYEDKETQRFTGCRPINS